MVTDIDLNPVTLNLSPEAFHLWAEDYYRCRQTFEVPGRFSPVPYFLLCRAIELELKSRHLSSKTQTQVQNDFWHHLVKSYQALSDDQKILNSNELRALECADPIYSAKGFEYFRPIDAMRGFSQFPDLPVLDGIAAKLISRGIGSLPSITAATDATDPA